MPTTQEHVDQANHNHDFWISLNNPTTPFTDWIVVGLFYEAVQWIEAFLSTQNSHSKNHQGRQTTMTLIPDLNNDPNLIGDYGILRIESENARYWCYRHTDAETASLTPLADRIRTTVRNLLGL